MDEGCYFVLDLFYSLRLRIIVLKMMRLRLMSMTRVLSKKVIYIHYTDFCTNILTLSQYLEKYYFGDMPPNSHQQYWYS